MGFCGSIGLENWWSWFGDGVTSLKLWIEDALQKLNDYDFNLFYWFIWFNRNQVVHGETCFIALKIAEMAISMMTLFLTASQDSLSSSPLSFPNQWHIPCPNFVRINFDDATYMNFTHRGWHRDSR